MRDGQPIPTGECPLVGESSRRPAGEAPGVAGGSGRAVADLGRALDLFHGAPAPVARGQTLRDLGQTGLVGAALAHKRLGRQRESRALMAELIRSFPDQPLDRAVYGSGEPVQVSAVLDMADRLQKGGV